MTRSRHSIDTRVVVMNRVMTLDSINKCWTITSHKYYNDDTHEKRKEDFDIIERESDKISSLTYLAFYLSYFYLGS